MRKPGIDELLVRSALDARLLARLQQSPDDVFAEYDLTDDEQETLRAADARMLALLGRAVRRRSPEQPLVVSSPQEPAQTPAAERALPEVAMVVTIVPCAQVEDNQVKRFSYAVWVNPLPEDADPNALPPPSGVTLPGQPMPPLNVVLQLSAVQAADNSVGLWAYLRQSTNVLAAPPALAQTEPDHGPPDIYIAGLGVQTATQITREVQDAIRASQEVLYLDTGVATRAALEELCPRVTSLYERTYIEGRPRMEAYERMAAEVISAALDHPPVTFAIHGHPLVAVHAPFLVMEQARTRGLRVRVLPGVSALDTILADLRIDPVVDGVQMYEATDLLLRRRPLQNDVLAILWQIGPLETCLHSSAASSPERFARLKSHLCRFYNRDHEAIAIYSSPHPLMRSCIHRTAIGNLEEYSDFLHAGFTLVIPPMLARPVQDLDLLEKIRKPAHLGTITHDLK